MTSLQNVGKRIDNTLSFLKNDFPISYEIMMLFVEKYFIPLLYDNSLSSNEEELMIKNINDFINTTEQNYKTKF